MLKHDKVKQYGIYSDYLSEEIKKTTDFESEYRRAEEQQKRYFTRMSTDYEAELMNRTRLVIIGTGGASSFIMNCARMGIGEYILIDPDIISDTNIATQFVTTEYLGYNKTDALAEQIINLNPLASVQSMSLKIEDIADDKFKDLITKPMRMRPTESGRLGALSPGRTILLVLTDNFYAQARGHRLGLQFGLSTICAQEYELGLGAEVTYTVPGVTPACHRCITASRYRAYLEREYKNKVTSAGAPIFAAEYLNAVLGHMLLAVIHYGSEHPRWGSIIKCLGNRNLLRLRMDNSFDTVFGNTFHRRINGASQEDAFYMLDTLFLPQTPDCGQNEHRPVCPDCGGTGNLCDSKGSFSDTTVLLMHAGDKSK